MGEAIATVLSPSGLGVLTALPKGSAEAELMSIAPVFYVFHYLEQSNNWHLLGPETLTSRTRLRRKMKEGRKILLLLLLQSCRGAETLLNEKDI